MSRTGPGDRWVWPGPWQELASVSRARCPPTTAAEWSVQSCAAWLLEEGPVCASKLSAKTVCLSPGQQHGRGSAEELRTLAQLSLTQTRHPADLGSTGQKKPTLIPQWVSSGVSCPGQEQLYSLPCLVQTQCHCLAHSQGCIHLQHVHTYLHAQ